MNDRRITDETPAKVTAVNQRIESGEIFLYTAEGKVKRDSITANLTADLSGWTTVDLLDLSKVISAYARSRGARVEAGTKE